MNKKQRRGISLVVLVITIIVIIILAGAVILSLSANNPISQASKATYLSDISNFKTELDLYKTQQYLNNSGTYDPTLLQADAASATYNSTVITSKTMNDLIPSLGRTPKYNGQFEVQNGELVFGGLDVNQKAWATEAGITVITIGAPKVTIIAPAVTAVAPGTDIVYTVKFASNVALTTINLAGKVEVLDNAGLALPSQPVITIGTISGTGSDVTRQVDITIKTDSLSYSTYKLKIKSGSVTNANNLPNADTTSPIAFDVTDNVPPVNPTMLANPTIATNGNVTVTITYSGDTNVKEYSLDGTTWNNYTIPVVVSNNITVYARGKDAAGNQNTGSTITITNIDKISPTVAYGTNGTTNPTSVSTTVTVSDLGGSNINTSTLQYIWDTQNITTPSSGWTTFTNGATQTKTGDGTYYLWVKANDTAGNSVVVKSNVFIIGDGTTIVSTIQTTNKTFAGATTGFTYNNPVIPAGFVAANTTDANWSNLSTDYDKGLVIQDSSNNQFVWVPVDGTNVPYAKWCTTGAAYNNASISDDTVPTGFSVTNITTTYKGFYIARYESSNNSGKVASKKASPWVNINYIDSKTYAENMDTTYGYDISKVATNLITGAEWDTAMKWIQNLGTSVTDSRTWGNHNDSMAPANIGNGSVQISGYSNNWKAKNIYDLAGNTLEWTNEIYNSYRVFRGGNCYDSGSASPAALRSYNIATVVSNYIGFRVVLYIL